MNQFKLGIKNTFDDWDILLSSFEIGEAQPKTNYIDLPGNDGSIDLTEALTGEIAYRDRTIEATFTFKPPRSGWRAMIDTIRAYCHGRKLHIVVPDDADHYYIGRVNVGALQIDGQIAAFDMTIVCDPFKYKNDVTEYDFTIGAIGTLTTALVNTRKRAIPTITVSALTQVTFGAVSVSLSAGPHVVTSIVLVEGNNTLTLTAAEGTTVHIEYQEGAL